MIVIVAQAAQISPQRRDFEESLVAALLMEDRLEVTVIPDLTQLTAESTGLLCLEGVKGDMLLLSWQPPLAAHQWLAQHQVIGRLGATRFHAPDSHAPDSHAPDSHTADPPVTAPGAESLPAGVYDGLRRTIYCLDLARFGSLDDARGEVRRIIAESRVRTVSLSDLAGSSAAPRQVTPPAQGPAAAGHSGPPRPARSDELPGAASPPVAAPSGQPPADSQPPPTNAQATLNAQAADLKAAGSDDPGLDDEQRLERQLDALVDELDDLEL